MIESKCFARTTVTALLFGLAAVSGVHAEVKDAMPSGFTVENSREVAAGSDRVWQALVREVDQWWPRDHTWWGEAGRLRIESRAGGCFCEVAGERQAAHMRVVFVDPGASLRMTGGLGPLQGMGLHGTLEWRLQPITGGTRITLWYRAGGYTPDDLSQLAAVVDKVQAQQLGALVDHLADAVPAVED